MRNNEFIKRFLSSTILIPIVLFFILKGSFLFFSFLLICFFITVYEWHMISKKKTYNFLGYFFLIFSFFTIYKLRINEAYSYWTLLFITTICISTDIGGYIFGKTFKGPKLIKISPNKTYTGMVGSYLLSIITIFFFSIYMPADVYFENWPIHVFLISTISQLGDILISYCKRLSNVKDTGKIIPGHGGLLDRVDGMIFAFPFYYLMILMDIF